jgi:heme-binding protein
MHISKEELIMKFNDVGTRRRIVGISAGCVLGGAVLAAAPVASAAPDCSPAGVAGTVSSVTGAAREYLNTHPGANQAVSAAYTQPRGEAAGSLRAYFTANPTEYYELRGILAPLGDTQRQCNVSVLPPDLASAYSQFMAG